MVNTYYRHWAFPLKSDSLDKSYDIFVDTLRGIDKDLGSMIIQTLGSNIKYFWKTQEERNSQAGMRVGDLGLQLSDSGLYIYESGGYWRLVAQLSSLPLVKHSKPTQNDYSFDKGQIWIDSNEGKLWFCSDNSVYNAIWKSFDNEISGKFIYDGLLFLDFPLNGIEVVNPKFKYLITQNGKFYFKSNTSHSLYLGKFKIGSFTPDSRRRTYFLKNDIIELIDGEGNLDNVWAARLLHMASLLLKKDNGFYSFVKTETISQLEKWYDNTYHFPVIDLTNIAKDEDKYNEFITKFQEFKGNEERIITDLNEFINRYNESVSIQYKIVSENSINPEEISLKNLQLTPLNFVQPQLPKSWGTGFKCNLNEVTPQNLNQKIMQSIHTPGDTLDKAEKIISPDIVGYDELTFGESGYRQIIFLKLFKNNSSECESGLANQLKFFYESPSNPGEFIEDPNPVIEVKENGVTLRYETGTIIHESRMKCYFYFCNKEASTYSVIFRRR